MYFCVVSRACPNTCSPQPHRKPTDQLQEKMKTTIITITLLTAVSAATFLVLLMRPSSAQPAVPLSPESSSAYHFCEPHHQRLLLPMGVIACIQPPLIATADAPPPSMNSSFALVLHGGPLPSKGVVHSITIRGCGGGGAAAHEEADCALPRTHAALIITPAAAAPTTTPHEGHPSGDAAVTIALVAVSATTGTVLRFTASAPIPLWRLLLEEPPSVGSSSSSSSPPPPLVELTHTGYPQYIAATPTRISTLIVPNRLPPALAGVVYSHEYLAPLAPDHTGGSMLRALRPVRIAQVDKRGSRSVSEVLQIVPFEEQYTSSKSSSVIIVIVQNSGRSGGGGGSGRSSTPTATHPPQATAPHRRHAAMRRDCTPHWLPRPAVNGLSLTCVFFAQTPFHTCIPRTATAG